MGSWGLRDELLQLEAFELQVTFEGIPVWVVARSITELNAHKH